MMGKPLFRILDRYIFGQFFTTFFLGVVLLSVVLVLGNVFKKLMDMLVDYEVSVEMILSFIAYALPFSLTFTIPWALLTAVLLLFGRLSAESELVAMRSLGISVSRLSVPIFVFAAAMCALCWWINVDISPRAQTKMKQTLFDIATSNPLSLFATDQIIEAFPGKKIYVQNKVGEDLSNIQVYEMNKEGLATSVTLAKHGKLETDLESKTVIMRLADARVQQRDAQNPEDDKEMHSGIRFASTSFLIPLDKLYEANEIRVGLSAMTMSELHKELAVREAAKDTLKKEDGPSPVKTEINKRYSFSLACAAFVLLGVPLGITTHRKETSIGFALSLAIGFSYFVLIILADVFRNEPAAHPEVLVWLPNVIFLVLGGTLFYRMSRR
jgi:LPS export ABC transporter permease LptF